MSGSSPKPDVIYEEWVPAGLLLRILVFGLGIPLFIALVVISLLVPEASNSLGSIIGFVALLVMLLTFWNYRGIRILVTDEAFEAKYGLLNRVHIPLSELEECQPVSSTFRKYLGIGVRYGFDGSYAYTTAFGPAVRIQRVKGRPFVVSTANPKALCEALERAKKLIGDKRL